MMMLVSSCKYFIMFYYIDINMDYILQYSDSCITGPGSNPGGDVGSGILCGGRWCLCHCGGVAFLLLHHTAGGGHFLCSLRPQQRGGGEGRVEKIK